MSYRTYVNGVQIFGNNECYPIWLDFLKSQGVTIGPEGEYDAQITDFMGAMEACENIVMDIEKDIDDKWHKLTAKAMANPEFAKRHRSLFDLTGIKENIMKPYTDIGYRPRLFDELYDRVDTGYLFMPLMLYHACEDDLVLDISHPTRFRAYKLKEGKTIHVAAG